MTIREELEKALLAMPDATDNDLARSLMRRLKPELLLPLLEAEIARLRRSDVRRVEQEAFAELFQKARIKAATPDPEFENYKVLFREKFALGDNTETLWATATIQQHVQRIEMLKKMRNGLDATIARHQTAIALIEKHGVTCLAEIDEHAAA